LRSISTDLRSDHIEQQIAALDKAAEIIDTLAQEAVNALTTTADPFLFAERLMRLGDAIVGPLEQLIEAVGTPPATKVPAALALLQLGSTVGVPLLLDVLLTDSEYVILAADFLANAQIAEAADRIIARLRMYDPAQGDLKQADVVASLVGALGRLATDLPIDLRSRLTAADVPWQVRTAVDPDEEARLRQRPAQGESWHDVVTPHNHQRGQ
jgi:hypothetical protein